MPGVITAARWMRSDSTPGARRALLGGVAVPATASAAAVPAFGMSAVRDAWVAGADAALRGGAAGFGVPSSAAWAISPESASVSPAQRSSVGIRWRVMRRAPCATVGQGTIHSPTEARRAGSAASARTMYAPLEAKRCPGPSVRRG